MATNTLSQQQKADFVEHDEEEVPESNGQDTGENGAQNATFHIMMNWKPFWKKMMKIHKWQQNKTSMI